MTKGGAHTTGRRSRRENSGAVVVAGIPVGLNYFTSIGPGQCTSDNVKLIINVRTTPCAVSYGIGVAHINEASV